MELNDKVTQLEDEIKILKNEVQAVLLDLRESFLSNINPFNPNSFTQTAPSVTAVISDTQNEENVYKEVNLPVQEIPIINKEPEIIENNNENEEIASFPKEEELPDTNFEIDDMFEDTAPSFVTESGPEKVKEPGIKEEKMVWHPELKVETQYMQKEAITVDTNDLNLETIDKLSLWVESSVNRLGPQRTRTILDITETMSYVNTDLKNILVKFIHPSADNENINATTRDYLAVLVELNKLLMGDNRMEIALLYFLILFQEYDNR